MVLASSFVFFAIAGVASAAVTKRAVCPDGSVTANAAVGLLYDEEIFADPHVQLTVLQVLRSSRRPPEQLVRLHLW